MYGYGDGQAAEVSEQSDVDGDVAMDGGTLEDDQRQGAVHRQKIQPSAIIGLAISTKDRKNSVKLYQDVSSPETVILLLVPELNGRDQARSTDREVHDGLNGVLRHAPGGRGLLDVRGYCARTWIAKYRNVDSANFAAEATIYIRHVQMSIYKFTPPPSSIFLCRRIALVNIDLTVAAQSLLDLFPDSRLFIAYRKMDGLKMTNKGAMQPICKIKSAKTEIVVAFERPTNIQRLTLAIPKRTRRSRNSGTNSSLAFTSHDHAPSCIVCGSLHHGMSSCLQMVVMKLPPNHPRLLKRL
jgi:hypothetical protein